MDLNRARRSALSHELKFYPSNSAEYQQLQLQIEELDRQHHSRGSITRRLPKEEMLSILSTPLHNVNRGETIMSNINITKTEEGYIITLKAEQYGDDLIPSKEHSFSFTTEHVWEIWGDLCIVDNPNKAKVTLEGKVYYIHRPLCEELEFILGKYAAFEMDGFVIENASYIKQMAEEYNEKQAATIM